ncbi:MAG: adenylosuccinate lyase [Myxococcales bacterium]|nr:adenylosuccinate lyase [Myxococcales bacterium]
MIARYTRPDMAALWSESRRLSLFLEVELAATAALEASPSSPIPAGTATRLRQLYAQVGPLDPRRVAECEQRTQHEVLAFLEHVEEKLGVDARWLHFGLTSSDVLDTVLALQLREATQIILRGIDDQLLPALRRQATAHQQTPMIGRTHGIFAEPISAGLVFLGSYAEIERAKVRIQRAQKAIAVGKLSGAVGVYGSGCFSPDVEAAALSSLGLSVETVPTQVVARDRHAELLLALSLFGSAIERLSVNLRHLQRSEVSEVEEAFAPGQKGSSAMPHKKNPISAENLCGLARLLRASASAACENIPLWHERDISHSSVERVIMPDATTLADYMVQRAAKLVGGLSIRADRMSHNLLQSGDLFASEKVMLALVRTGLSRQSAYELVQRHALSCVADRGGLSFFDRLRADPQVSERLPEDVLGHCFEITTHLQHVSTIFARTLPE